MFMKVHVESVEALRQYLKKECVFQMNQGSTKMESLELELKM